MEKIIEIIEHQNQEELFGVLKTAIINGEFTVNDVLLLVEEEQIVIDLDIIEELIAEIDYISELQEQHYNNQQEIYKEELGSSHCHNDEGGAF